MLIRLNNVPRLYIYVFLFLGLLSNFSCQESALIEEIEIASDENTTSDSSTHLKNLDDGEILERRMQWASYISARILCQDDEAREEVATFLDLQNTNAVSIDQLIVSTEHTPRFREIFIDQVSSLLYHIDGGPKPSHNQPIPPSSRQINLTSALAFVDYLTVDNCIELFFPNGLSTVRSSAYYSTAHPMTLAQSNYGYEISCADIGFGVDSWGSIETTINEPFVQGGREVIVTRPYRTVGPLKCTYSKYDNIDFTQFLN